MNYETTNLSNGDKIILDEIYHELEMITLPTTYCGEKRVGNHHARKIGVTEQRDARQTVFGMTYYRGSFQASCYTKKYPNMFPLFQKFIESHHPEFKFNSVYVNRNTISKKHVDSKNCGVSLIVGLGPYTGGKTVLYNSDGNENEFSINTHGLIFNGSNIPHRSDPFEGTRYSLVFFN